MIMIKLHEAIFLINILILLRHQRTGVTVGNLFYAYGRNVIGNCNEIGIGNTKNDVSRLLKLNCNGGQSHRE
jgi:hypothetical protein